MNDNRDINLIAYILKYCEEIEGLRLRFGDSYEDLSSDYAYKNAVSMSILQIGELANKLTNDFKISNNNIPWNQIIRMRNIAAHHYDKFSTKRLLDIIKLDIPELQLFCKKQLNIIQCEDIAKETAPKSPHPR
jgi:uncharacterized protein with HEPN domain